METFEELTYFVDKKEYMKAYGKVMESIDNADLDKAKSYLSLLKLRGIRPNRLALSSCLIKAPA